MRIKRTTTVLVELTIETSLDDAEVRRELFNRYGRLAYVWNNAAGLYGPTGTYITAAREVALPDQNYCPTCGQPDNCGDCNHQKEV